MSQFTFEGRSIPYESGDTIAAAMYRANVRTFSRSFKYHRRRGLYCLSGDCPSCLVTVDGRPCVRSCETPAAGSEKVSRQNAWPSAERDVLAIADRFHWLLPVGFYYKLFVRPRWSWRAVEGLIRRAAGLGRVDRESDAAHMEARHRHADVLVIGAGAAGLSAALAAAGNNENVTLVEEATVGARVAPGPYYSQIERLAGAVRAAPSITLIEQATAFGIYEGPVVPVATRDQLEVIHPQRIVVCTGAREQHAVFEGNDLPGVFLGRGAARLAGVHGVRPGSRAVIVASGDEAVHHARVLRRSGVEIVAVAGPRVLADQFRGIGEFIPDGRLLAAQGRRAVRGAVIEGPEGKQAFGCDHIVVSDGLVPRGALLRQAPGLPVTPAGEVAAPGCSVEQAIEDGARAGSGTQLPPAAGLQISAGVTTPMKGMVCLCEDVDMRDLDQAWSEGFQSTELLKRYTTATMGPCQGALCHDSLCAFVKGRGGSTAQASAVTARPPARPVLLEQVAAGQRHQVEYRTALHQRHIASGAIFEWAGHWRRPRHYGDTLGEYWAVRRRAGLMDLGTMGKFIVAGPDATAFLERVYPSRIHNIKPGRMRYSVLLNEEGAVIDDGVICALDNGYFLTTTTGGADNAEAWLRDWAEAFSMRVHIVSQTAALGTIIVSGPSSRAILADLCTDPIANQAMPFASHAHVNVAGVRCLAVRLGYVGELSYELHHPAQAGPALWDALMEAGRKHQVRPYGLDALRTLRLEKGHFVLGQDTDFDTSAWKLDLGWLVKMDKEWFVGKAATERLATIPPREKLVKLAFDGRETPFEGAPITVGGRYAGRLTSSRYSPVLDRGVALAWVRNVDGSFPDHVEAEGQVGTVVTKPLYDPEGELVRA